MMQIQTPMHGIVLSGEPVLVPGIGIFTEDCQPYARGMARVDVVAQSLLSGIEIPQLYLTGGKATETMQSEADEIECELIRRVGVDMLLGTVVTKETESINSLGNFINMADLLASERPDALSLVTDWPHMPRILAIARKIVSRKTKLVPVITHYTPGFYDAAREVPALPITALTLIGVSVGNTTALHNRVQKYNVVKRAVKTTLHRL